MAILMDWSKYINATNETIGFYGRYFLIAGLFYWIFYKWKKTKYARYKIQAQFPEKGIIKKEILYSIISLAIYSVISAVILKIHALGYTNIYLSISDYGWLYLIFSFIIVVFFHDAYFYWTHRLLHTTWLLKHVHQVHHQSLNPTPWAAFCFHPIEAIISALYLPLAIIFFPMHPIAIISFLFYMTLINVMGHSGFEWFSVKFRKSKIGGFQNTSTLHNLHHKKGRNNYGLYFTFWDKLMRTYKE